MKLDETNASFVPMSISVGARIRCELCPQATDRHALTPLPYGDERRIKLVLSTRRRAIREDSRLQLARAEYVEA
jgi:hypothetical protein